MTEQSEVRMTRGARQNEKPQQNVERRRGWKTEEGERQRGK